MKEKAVLAVLVAIGLPMAACADTTTSLPGSDDANASVDAGLADDDVAESVESGSDVAVTDTPSSDTQQTDPPATDPPATDPPATDPPLPVSAPFDGVATFYGGSRSGLPWVPLGWWDGVSWNDVGFDAAGELIPLPEPDVASVSATSLDLGDGPDSVIDGLVLGEQQEYCVGFETGPVIDLPVVVPDTPASLGYDTVAVSADWPLQPRPVRQVGVEVEEYATVGAGFFPSIPDAASTGDVLQVVRVDLDGDSVEEVLVAFENITADFGAAGDFSGVYARYPSADGTVVDELLVSHISEVPDGFPTIGRFTIAAVADLNGDAVMEVIFRDMFWESGGMGVFALQDGRLVRVAGNGCGL